MILSFTESNIHLDTNTGHIVKGGSPDVISTTLDTFTGNNLCCVIWNACFFGSFEAFKLGHKSYKIGFYSDSVYQDQFHVEVNDEYYACFTHKGHTPRIEVAYRSVLGYFVVVYSNSSGLRVSFVFDSSCDLVDTIVKGATDVITFSKVTKSEHCRLLLALEYL